MKKLIEKLTKRARRAKRVRSKMFGTADKPRLSFNRSNRNIFAQLIDDEKSNTLIGLSSIKLDKMSMSQKASEIGKLIAKEAKAKGIEKVVFDRGGFLYTGSVKVFADSAREGGLKF